MSATLFGRGVMTQVGGRQRAEATDKAISALRAELASLQTLSTQIRILEARLQATERKVTTLEGELGKANAAITAVASMPSSATVPAPVPVPPPAPVSTD